MKFEEKLMNLRKQKGLSQEELAEKLNVTRQTISKWELGQSKPDMDKLIELSKLFEVGIEELTNDTVNVNKEKKPAKKQERKYLLYILILILLASVITLIIRLGLAHEERKEAQEGFFNNIFGGVTNIIEGQLNNNDNTMDDITDQFNNAEDLMNNMQDMFEQENKKVNKNTFNIHFTYAEGTKQSIFVKNILDHVVTSNKTYKDMLIEVEFDGKVTSDTDEIKDIKKALDEWGEYEVSVDYDQDGYVNKITIEE